MSFAKNRGEFAPITTEFSTIDKIVYFYAKSSCFAEGRSIVLEAIAIFGTLNVSHRFLDLLLHASPDPFLHFDLCQMSALRKKLLCFFDSFFRLVDDLRRGKLIAYNKPGPAFFAQNFILALGKNVDDFNPFIFFAVRAGEIEHSAPLGFGKY